MKSTCATLERAQLHRDCHVQIDGGFYSVPWRLIGTDLWARCTRASVALYHGDEHLWTHGRVGRGRRSTVEGHLPEGRRDLRHRSAAHWLERAKAIGPETLLLVEEVFASDDVLSKPRAVQAIVTHLGKHPADRAEAAARRARLFPDDLMASAAMDRLLHHAEVVVLDGQSYRNRKAS